jgi:hypothetical protein
MIGHSLRRWGLIAPVMLALLASINSRPSAAESRLCAVGEPSSVLKCVSTAYITRDLAAYEALLANDFRYIFNTEANTMSRAEEVTSARSLFGDSTVKSITLSFNADFNLAPGSEPSTWVLSNLVATLHADRLADDRIVPIDVTTKGTIEILVRLESKPEPHYVIYRWWDHVEE